MNPYKNLLFLYNKNSGFADKTEEVVECHYQEGKYKVQFTNNKIYTYTYDGVRWYREPTQLDAKKYRIYYNRKSLYHIQRILVFATYWKIFYENVIIREST